MEMIVFNASTAEELRDEIVRFLEFTADREERSEKTAGNKTQAKIYHGRCSLAQLLTFQIKDAKLRSEPVA